MAYGRMTVRRGKNLGYRRPMLPAMGAFAARIGKKYVKRKLKSAIRGVGKKLRTGFNELIKPSVYKKPQKVQKTLQRRVHNADAIINRQLVNSQMIRYTRFLLKSFNMARSNPFFDKAGTCRMLTTDWLPALTTTTSTNQTLATALGCPGLITRVQGIVFTPQWIGCTLAPFDHYLQGSGLGTNPNFGIVGPFSTTNTNPNLKTNQVGSADAYSYLGGQDGSASTTLEKNWNRIRVLKCAIEIKLFNNQQSYPMDVHIIVFKYTDDEFLMPASTGTSDTPTWSCIPIDTVGCDQIYNYITDTQYRYSNGGNMPAVVNTQRMAQINSGGVQAQKLLAGKAKAFPGKIMKVYSHRVVHLPKTVLTVATPIFSAQPKFVRMNFGAKVWTRDSCLLQDQPFNSGYLKEKWSEALNVMMWCVPTEQINIAGTATNDTTDVSTACAFEIRKTLAWREL